MPGGARSGVGDVLGFGGDEVEKNDGILKGGNETARVTEPCERHMKNLFRS